MLHKTRIGKFKPKSLIAVFKYLLKNEHAPVTNNSKTNLEYAEQYKSYCKWHTLIIREKFVMDETFPGKDLSLNMDVKEFQRSLDNLFNSVRGK